jgi:hypothetical protein
VLSIIGDTGRLIVGLFLYFMRILCVYCGNMKRIEMRKHGGIVNGGSQDDLYCDDESDNFGSD